MNYTVIPKSITTFHTGNNKPLDIYVWAYIKLCSDFSTGISHITQDKLSLNTGIPERTIRNSIKRLKDGGYLQVQTKITDGFKKRNSYHFQSEKVNVSLIDNSFFHKGYSPTIAGFMLLIRSICLNNTDKVLWSKTKIAEEIGIGRATTSTLLTECVKLGLLNALTKGYEITEKSLSWRAFNNQVNNPIFKAICDFCESKGVNPPVWDKDAMSVIETRYNTLELPPDHEFNITYQLDERCKRLPKKVTLAYFVKVLGMDEHYRALRASKPVDKNEYNF